MGFNDWNSLAARYPPWSPPFGFNASAVLSIAQALVSTGLKEAGYTYVNIDCGWSTGFRTNDGAVVANATLYPGGLKKLFDQIHDLGLRAGIYTSGTMCCGPKGANDGIVGHELIDVEHFVDIGVDYLKNDDCGSTSDSFALVAKALNASGRRILHSIHTSFTHGHADALDPGHARPVANIFRTTPDIRNDWSSILDRIEKNDAFADLAGPGYFNDPDMLEIGVNGVSDAEGRSQMALWSIAKAPLLIGCDLTVASKATLATLGAREVIAVNQDALGVQGRIIEKTDTTQVWAGLLVDGCHAMVLLNSGNASATIAVSWASLGFPPAVAMHVRDLWRREDLGTFVSGFNTTIAIPHDNAMIKVCAV
eukprot:g1297.t1